MNTFEQMLIDHRRDANVTTWFFAIKKQMCRGDAMWETAFIGCQMDGYLDWQYGYLIGKYP
jgi:hypothetical protein